ncbi:MAG: asparagine synthase (glutamine-hydrolyzing) [Sphingobium sp.]|nr:MAG: asparagine synthase (glutamine-hydrolyzing) [Sphingobium sp.]
MCGIAGFWRPSGLGPSDKDILTSMTDRIIRRGPDASGAWFDQEKGVAFGHRRLSIIDLSEAGAQPMASANGRFIITYNGEIYNFEDIRQQLRVEGHHFEWRGHSDTEVILAGIMSWGVERTLKALNGMFAFALWDRQTGQLTIARDRMGEKPLYYGWTGHGPHRALLFASDLAALRAYPEFEPETAPESVGLLLRYGHIPDPHCIYRNISKLRPGAAMTFDAEGREQFSAYWDTIDEYVSAQANPFAGSPEDAVDELERLLTQAVQRQSVADVPLGTFLSGGVDSSAVTALLQASSSSPIKTFSIGFTVKEYDESPHARAVAEHLGTDHHEMIVSPSEAQAVIPSLPSYYSEPFADSSQVPTYLVSKMAREVVTVALSGDAGDEMFAGYNRHIHAHKTWPAISRIPRPVRLASKYMIEAISPNGWDQVDRRLLGGKMSGLGEKLHKTANILASRDGDSVYQGLLSINQNVAELAVGSVEYDGFEGRDIARLAKLSLTDQMMAKDCIHYLPGDILTKVDRAAMAVSLETRVPMLDVDVMRFAWSLPVDIKLAHGVTKWPLREVLYRHVPRKLIERPKHGFGIPIHVWLRGPLREWAEDLLSFPENGQYFNMKQVNKIWNDHLSGRRNFQHKIWPILMFAAWEKSNLSNANQ